MKKRRQFDRLFQGRLYHEPAASQRFDIVAEVAISPARRATFEALLRVERDAAYSDAVLHSHLLDDLDRRGRALVTEIVMGCLRRRGELDFLLSGRLSKPVRSLDIEVRTALRIGAYQLRCMAHVSAGAAVSDSVDLVKAARKRSAAGLVNAVLRNLPEALSIEESARHSHPDWLTDRWRTNLGEAALQQFLRANICRPPTYVRLTSGANGPDTIKELTIKELGSEGVALDPTAVENAFRVSGGNVSNSRAARDGRLVVQGLGSQLVAPLLSVEAGHRVLDLCSAPGGKARQLAEVAPVVAADRHAHRLRTMRALGAKGLRLLSLDAEHPLPFRAQFDRVLVDAPCSGTGTLARNPEIKWRLKPSDLDELHARQVKILSNALDVVAPNGRLIYSTCSLEPEENEHVVAEVLDNRSQSSSHKVLDRLPGRDAGDGFQAWLISRNEG